jgi:membrane fusion protein (multidrug efflux system)
MTTAQQPPGMARARFPFPRISGKIVPVVVLTGVVVVLFLYLAGVFQRKVPTDREAAAPTATARSLAEVRLVRQPRYETAVGTVRAIHEVALAPRLLARVTEVNVKAGQAVSAGQVLVRLDDSDLQARLKQAEAAVVSARAAKERAARDVERGRALQSSGGVSQEELDQRETALKTASADLDRSQQAEQEAKVLLDFTILRSPLTGVVIDKRVEPGDTVSPGQVLLTLYDPGRMQMVASVRESLARRLAVGQKVPARLDALNLDCHATISEIVPEAQTASRSFLVKVTGPCPSGVYSGMFGRVFIPLDEEEVVVVPATAVYRVGQLDMVEVDEGGVLRRRSIQLGRTFGQDDEVLAGLRPGEKVALRPDRKEGQP